MSSISFSGLVSGLDTQSLVPEILRFDQRRIDVLELRKAEAEFEAQLFDEVESRVQSLRSEVSSLTRSVGSVFDASTVSSSDESLVTAAAGTGATPGTHVIRVNQLARVSQEGSQGFAAANSKIGRGTFEISAGGAAANITIDATNDTLEGLRSEINAAGVGVSATIIDTGAASDPFRLLLSSNETGTDNALSITNNLNDTAVSGSVQPTFTTVQSAQNSQIQIGNGGGAILIENASNTVQGFIPGVTLQLQSADPAKEVTLQVQNDVSSAGDAIHSFVGTFNELNDFIAENSQFNAETGEAGPLFGDRSIISVLNSIRTATLGVSGTLPSSINRLSVLGISFSADGRLAIDEGRLNAALNGNVNGIEFSDVQRIFGLSAESTNIGIEFILGSTRTKELDTPIEVNIISAAQQASVTATNTLAASTVINSGNADFEVEINGRQSGTLTLASGTYTREALASELESAINSASTLSGSQVSVSVNADKLVVTTQSFGLSAEVSNFSGTAIATLGFDGTETDRGQDVVGQYLVDGVIETATGSGQVLVGNGTNANTADLRVLVTLDQTQVTGGVEGELVFSRGVGSRLEQALESILDPINGRLKLIDDGIQSQIDEADEAISRQTEAFSEREAALLRQFATVERLIGQSQSLTELITAQLTPFLNQNN